MREKKVSDEGMSPKALFIIACVILAVSMVTFALSMVWVQDMFAPAPEMGESSESGLPGGEIIGMMLVMFANIVMVTLILLFHAFLWGGGMLVSARLAFSRQEKPKWMQIGAWVLTAVFAVPTTAALCLVGYVVCTLFFMT
jgi:hypothetical protein